jgi:hypothetical protein
VLHRFPERPPVSHWGKHDDQQQPSLGQPAHLIILEDAGQQTISLSRIGAGQSESRLLLITAVRSNSAIILNPSVCYTGLNVTSSLHFTPALDANGTATSTLTARDGSGINGGGGRYARAPSPSRPAR